MVIVGVDLCGGGHCWIKEIIFVVIWCPDVKKGGSKEGKDRKGAVGA